MEIRFERGVIVDGEGHFIAAVQWQEGSQPPSNLQLNGARPEGSKAPRLRLIRDPEAIADPMPGGKWDARAKAWQSPNVEMWVVNVRRDLPRYGVLSGGRRVWPGRLPPLQSWQAWVTDPPPKTRRGRKPMYDFEAGEWIVPVSVAIYDDDGTCLNVVVKPRLEPGDEEAHEVEDEIGQRGQIGPGIKHTGGHAPNYRKVPARFVLSALHKHGLADDFMAFMRERGFAPDDVRQIKKISLNNKHLRAFVWSKGYTMKQAFQKIQIAAQEECDAEEKAERDKIADLEAEGDDG